MCRVKVEDCYKNKAVHLLVQKTLDQRGKLLEHCNAKILIASRNYELNRLKEKSKESIFQLEGERKFSYVKFWRLNNQNGIIICVL